SRPTFGPASFRSISGLNRRSPPIHCRRTSLFPTMCAITRATIADADSIARLLAEAFASYRALYTLAGFAATTPTAEVIASRMHEGPTWISGSVATLSAIAKRKDLYLRSMAVHPVARGRGIGAQLLEIAEQFARDQRC